MKLSEYQITFTLNIASLIEYANYLSIGLTFGEANRPQSMQLLNYYGYIIKESEGALILMKVKRTSHTLNSKHNERLAVDFNFFIAGKLTYNKDKLQKLGDFWESLHSKNRWGGNFKSFIDTPHFEMNL